MSSDFFWLRSADGRLALGRKAAGTGGGGGHMNTRGGDRPHGRTRICMAALQLLALER